MKRELDLYRLLERLRYERVDSRFVSIGSPFREGTYCLERTEPGEWHVFSVERGQRIADAAFESETAACTTFLARILRDSTVRRAD